MFRGKWDLSFQDNSILQNGCVTSFTFRRKNAVSGKQHRMANTLGYLSVLEWETVEGVLTHGAYRHTDDRKITEEFYEHMLVLMCEDEISSLLPSTKRCR